MNPQVPDGDSFRVSDAERESAMAALGRAFSEGRLSLTEYDSRVQRAASAKLDSELVELFTDLPQANELAVPGSGAGPIFSSQELDRAYKSGKNTRLGILGLSTVGAIGACIALESASYSAFALISLLIIPVVWLLLYVSKVGPEQWYAPSVRALQRQRRRELAEAEKLREAERRIAERERLADLRLERKERAGELTNRALGFVSDAINNKGSDKKI